MPSSSVQKIRCSTARLTLNGDVFFYNYKGYQISEIVDRTAINRNFNATVKGAELETSVGAGAGTEIHTSRAAMKIPGSTMDSRLSI